MRSWKLVLGSAIVVAAGVAGYVATRQDPALVGGNAGAAPAPAAFAMPVPIAGVVKKTIPIFLEYTARTESISNVTLQARVSGYVQEQAAADGADVKVGDLLYRIDQRDYQAALDQAKAQAQRDQAALEYARSNLDRGSELAKSGYLAKDSYDQRNSTLKQAEAALVADQAAVRQAELNLTYTEIRAPFSGRIGRNQAPVGTLINIAGAALNTLVQLDPIYVTFNPSETELAEIQQARANARIEAEVVVPGSTQPPHKGGLTFIDNAVDRSTGTITARATIDNKDFTLLPGQYLRIRLKIREAHDALLVPQVAVGSSQFGKFLYVVGEGNKADQRLVSLGPAEGELVSVTKGIAEGDKIIVGNLQKIGPGAPVQPLPPQPQQKPAGS